MSHDSELRRLAETFWKQMNCGHLQREGGNDYILCPECLLQWDYRKESAEVAALNIFAEAVARSRAATWQPYLQHKPDCECVRAKQFAGVTLGEGGRCTCGLRALLSDPPVPEPRST